MPTCVLCDEHLPAGHGVNIYFEADRGGQVCCPQCHVMFADLMGVLNTAWPAFAAEQGVGGALAGRVTRSFHMNSASSSGPTQFDDSRVVGGAGNKMEQKSTGGTHAHE